MSIRASLFQILRRSLRRGAGSQICESVRHFKANEADILLYKLLQHCYQQVPYYSTIIDTKKDLVTQFRDMPLLTKEVIRSNFERLKSEDLYHREWFLNSSGGSTGRPITLVQDKEFRDWSNAAEDLFFTRFLGIKNYATVTKIYLWGSERDLFKQRSAAGHLINYIADRIFINAFKMTEVDLRRTVSIINKRKPVLLKGYAGSLYQLAIFINKNNLKVHVPRVIYSAAETLYPFMRKVIEEVFQCKVFDYYGSREVGAIAGQCSHGKMHVFTFNNLVEVVDDRNQPVPPGQEGRILITTLHNFAMPLVRYDIGDTAILTEGCDCGIDLPVLEKITGRVTDHFVTQEGTLVNGEYFTHLFYFKDWLSGFQVTQKDVKTIAIDYVADTVVPSVEAEDIKRKIRFVMGHDCRIQWCKVNEILPTPQGKYLFTRSFVAGNVDLIKEGAL